MLMKIMNDYYLKFRRVIDTSDIYRTRPDLQIFVECEIFKFYETETRIIAYGSNVIATKLKPGLRNRYYFEFEIKLPEKDKNFE
jgi:hypothetical protein